MAKKSAIQKNLNKEKQVKKNKLRRDRLKAICSNRSLPMEQEIDLDILKELIKKRDFEDSNREISPLIKANDAIEIITDGYSINEVVDKIIDLYNDKIPKEIEIK